MATSNSTWQAAALAAIALSVAAVFAFSGYLVRYRRPEVPRWKVLLRKDSLFDPSLYTPEGNCVRRVGVWVFWGAMAVIAGAAVVLARS